MMFLLRINVYVSSCLGAYRFKSTRTNKVFLASSNANESQQFCICIWSSKSYLELVNSF